MDYVIGALIGFILGYYLVTRVYSRLVYTQQVYILALQQYVEDLGGMGPWMKKDEDSEA